ADPLLRFAMATSWSLISGGVNFAWRFLMKRSGNGLPRGSNRKHATGPESWRNTRARCHRPRWARLRIRADVEVPLCAFVSFGVRAFELHNHKGHEGAQRYGRRARAWTPAPTLQCEDLMKKTGGEII